MKMNINQIPHGEFLTLRILQNLFGEFLAVSKQTEFLDGLLPKIKDDESIKGKRYYEMLAMFIHEFKKQADIDPEVKEMIEAEQRAQMMAQMSNGGQQQ